MLQVEALKEKFYALNAQVVSMFQILLSISKELKMTLRY